MHKIYWGIAAVILSLGAMGCNGYQGSSAGSNLSVDEQAVTAPVCAAGATVQGVDVSFWQGTINWPAVKASGREFAIARVSDGVKNPDSEFSDNWANIKSAGLIRGAYQFFRPGQDAAAQAKMVVDSVGRLGPGELPVMLDVEATDGLSSSAIVPKIHQWVDIVTKGTGKTPMIYTGAYFWDDYVKTSDFASFPLIVAWYKVKCPGTPDAWKGKWRFHQYSSTSSVPGISGNCDVDVFNGSLAELKAFAGGSSDETTDAVQFADLDGDGKSEIIAVYPNGDVKAWRNVNGLPSNGNTYTAGSTLIGVGFKSPMKIYFADIDGDRRAEIIAVYPNGDVKAWRNVHGLQGDKNTYTEEPKVIGTGFSSTMLVRFADIDGDGKAEIIAISPNGEVRAWLNVNAMNSQQPTFAAESKLIGTGFDSSLHPLFGDLDDSHRAEIISNPQSGDLTAFTNVNGMSGNGNTFFGSTLVGKGFKDPKHTKFADLDGDGKDEVILVHSNGDVQAWSNVNGLKGDANTYTSAPIRVGLCFPY